MVAVKPKYSMALTTGSDISVVLSGGTNNLDPNLSLGGSPSAAPIVDDVLNNLFDDVLPAESTAGMEDYRCIYFFNDGETTIFNLNVFIDLDFDAGAVLEIGISNRDESQRIQITGSPNGGSLIFSYENVQFATAFNSNLGAWAVDIQNSLNALTTEDDEVLLRDVLVTGQNTGSAILFDIVFAGQDGSKNHETLSLVSNNLTPSAEVTISTLQEGGPVNTIAPEISTEIIPPGGGVVFFASAEDDPVIIPKLRSGEGFPIWFHRTVAAGTLAVANDGFRLKFVAESLDPEE
jgi:hypothetical protein